MARLILKRLGAGIGVLLSVCTITFFLLYLRGGEVIVRNILGKTATQEEVATRVVQLGLDRPVLEQFFDWITGALTGDLGVSFATRQPVTDILATRLPITLSLVVVGLVFITLLSVLVGVAAAVRGGALDRVLQVVSVAAAALPGFWVALVLVLVFAIAIKLFPATGFVPISKGFGPWLASITLPVVAISIASVASVAQQIRGSMLDVMRQDYVRTLRSRGISRRAVIYRHALRNAAGPALTVLSFQVIGLLGGSVIIERVFAIAGLGTLAVTAGETGDIPVVMGVVSFMVLVVVGVNVTVEVLNGLLNPKARVR